MCLGQFHLKENITRVLMCDTNTCRNILDTKLENGVAKLNQTSLVVLAQLCRANTSHELAELLCQLTFCTLQHQ